MKYLIFFTGVIISFIITSYIFYSIIDHLPYTNFFGEIDHKIEPTLLNGFVSKILNKPDLLEYTFVQGNIISKFVGWIIFAVTFLILANLYSLMNSDFKKEFKDILITTKNKKLRLIFLYFFGYALVFSILSLALEFLRFNFWS